MGWSLVFAWMAIAGTPSLSASPPRKMMLVAAPEDSPLFEAVSRVLEAHTDLQPIAIEQLELDPSLLEGCSDDAVCLAELVSSVRGSLPDAVYLLSAAVVDPEDAELSVELELAVIHEKRAGTDVARIRSSTSDREIEGACTEALRDPLERDGHWEPYGAIVISAVNEGMRVELDGARVGDTSAPVTTVEHVPPGSRSVRLTHEDSEYFGVVSVQRGEVSSISPGVAVRTDVLSGSGRSVAFWSSAGAFALGVGLTGIALAEASSEPHFILCLSSAKNQDCSVPTRLGAGFGPYDAPHNNYLGNIGPMLSIGAGLASAGVVGAILSMILDDEQQATFLPAVLGSVVGGMVTAVILTAQQ